MNNSFYGHTPNVNGLLNLDHSDTHIHSIDAKRCKVDNDNATYLMVYTPNVDGNTPNVDGLSCEA